MIQLSHHFISATHLSEMQFPPLRLLNVAKAGLNSQPRDPAE